MPCSGESSRRSVWGNAQPARPCARFPSPREQLAELARSKRRFGDRRSHVLLGSGGERMNYKRIFRVYRDAGLAVRRKARKRMVRAVSPHPALTAADQE